MAVRAAKSAERKAQNCHSEAIVSWRPPRNSIKAIPPVQRFSLAFGTSLHQCHPTSVHPGAVRIDGQPAAAHAPARPQEHAQNLETRSEFAEAYRSAARARKAERRLRRLFATVRRNAKGQRAFVELMSTCGPG